MRSTLVAISSMFLATSASAAVVFQQSGTLSYQQSVDIFSPRDEYWPRYYGYFILELHASGPISVTRAIHDVDGVDLFNEDGSIRSSTSTTLYSSDSLSRRRHVATPVGVQYGGWSFRQWPNGNWSRVEYSYRDIPKVTLSHTGWWPNNAPITYQVTFTEPPPSIPEPATWAMMIAGFGLVGGAMRRRRREAPAKA